MNSETTTGLLGSVADQAACLKAYLAECEKMGRPPVGSRTAWERMDAWVRNRLPVGNDPHGIAALYASLEEIHTSTIALRIWLEASDLTKIEGHETVAQMGRELAIALRQRDEAIMRLNAWHIHNP